MFFEIFRHEPSETPPPRPGPLKVAAMLHLLIYVAKCLERSENVAQNGTKLEIENCVLAKYKS